MSIEPLRARLGSGAVVVGTFVKTPHHVVVEVLALSGLDVLCLDAEHAPFDRNSIDRCVMAARAAGKPLLVRVPVASPEHVQTALDCGASGVLAPHVRSVEDAQRLVRMCRYAQGGRGFSGSTREGGYGSLATEHHLAHAFNTVVIAQVEDSDAVDDIDAIAAVDGVDALFIGPADLAMSMGTNTTDSPQVSDAIAKVCDAAKRQGRAVGTYIGHVDQIADWRRRGATFFLVGSDQTMLLAGADQTVDVGRAQRRSA